ncbi:MAG: hypothetical protein II713_05760 [Clostridia bacterium]|nr:hypothetical protein [Clostridia bacterium]
MQDGTRLYFDAWIKHNHCYHPSLPLRSEQILEDLKACHATTLVWRDSAGGSISLPYLEHEAWKDVDPRMRTEASSRNCCSFWIRGKDMTFTGFS